MIKVCINGTLEAIKKERPLKDAYLVEFVVVNNDDKRPQHYLLRAISANSQKDKYRIGSMIGQVVSADCYLNGRKSESDTSTQPYFNNDLKVIGITPV